MQKLLPVLMFSFLFFTACQTQDNTEAINAISNTLGQANKVIIDDNEAVYESLVSKLKDPQTQWKAKVWYPKALAVKALSAEVYKYIGALEEQLRILKEDQASIRELFRKEADSLYNKLLRYNNAVMQTLNPEVFNDNPMLKANLIKEIESFKKSIESRSGIFIDSLSSPSVPDQQWIKTYLHISSPSLGMAILNKIQNDVLTTENSVVGYMNAESKGYHDAFDVFHAIAVLNSSYVKAGQPIEVTAGVGAFSAASQPKITINGSAVKLDDDGAATYKLTTNQKPGKYHVPVRIEYTKPDGSTAVVTKNLEYIIAE